MTEALNFRAAADGLFWMSWEDFIRTFSDIEVSHKTMRSGPGAMGSAEAGGCPLGQLLFHKGISKLFDAHPTDCMHHVWGEPNDGTLVVHKELFTPRFLFSNTQGHLR